MKTTLYRTALMQISYGGGGSGIFGDGILYDLLINVAPIKLFVPRTLYK
jgi:hypothetical protein